MGASKENNIIWHNEKRKIKDLIETKDNPRFLTKKEYLDLKNSIGKFDLAEIPAINTNNNILAGHQRLKVLAELKGNDYEIDVRVPNRELTEDEAKEYLIRSNKNTGQWDFDLLANKFEVEDLKDWGFEELELGLNVEEDAAEDNTQGITEKYQIILDFRSTEEKKLAANKLRDEGYVII